MTIQKTDVITLPKWLIILVLPILVSLITSYGIYTAKQGVADEKIRVIEIQVAERITKNENTLMIQNLQIQLADINTRLTVIEKTIREKYKN